MTKKWLIAIGGTAILVLLLFTAAFADTPVKLVVNGNLISTEVAPQIVNGRTLVPVRSVAEALGAKVGWLEESNTVTVETPELASLQRQVELLQKSVTPKTPREAVEQWANGVKDRNGALQYAVLSPELKKQKLSDFESFNWVTGTSSPWVERLEIVKETQTGEGVWEYEVRFELATSTGPAGSEVSRVTVKQYDPDSALPTLHPSSTWYISQIS